jgi:hypothetical protein
MRLQKSGFGSVVFDFSLVLSPVTFAAPVLQPGLS